MAGLGPSLTPTKKKAGPLPPLKVENRVGIQAPAEVIWDLVSNFDGWERWNPTYTEAEGTVRIGAPLAFIVALPGLPERRLDTSVIEWVPYEQLIWAEQDWRGWAKWIRYVEIDEVEKGACILSNGAVFDGFMAKRYGKKHRRAMRAGFLAMSEALKNAAEVRWQDEQRNTR